MNKRFIYLIVLILLLSAQVSMSQQKEEGKFNITFSGYVKTDFLFDSRQTISAREGHFLLYPANESLDKNGEDINAKSNFNILSIQTRLISKLSGPDALGAKTSGYVEGEFFGTADGDVNGLRLRHAFMTLKWSSTSLLIGQTWHPMFVSDVFPQVISFNTGVPFQPFSRNPQLRFTQSFGDLNFILAAIGQRDFTSSGPSGYSSAYLRNAGIPEGHFQLQYKSEKLVLGGGVDYKIIQPRLETTKKIKTDKTIGGAAALGYIKVKLNSFTFMAEGVYGQNNADLMMLGGYGIKSVDTTSGKEEYSTINAYSVWSYLSYGNDFQVGLFAGYSKNLGSADNLIGSPYVRAKDIDDILRISPRIQYTSGPVQFASEFEYTSAGYGKTDKNGKVINPKKINNSRFLFAAYYFF